MKKKKRYRLLSLVLALSLSLGLYPQAVRAEEPGITAEHVSEEEIIGPPSDPIVVEPVHLLKLGRCGEKLTYGLDDTYTLTISGSGEMISYQSPEECPWNEFTDDRIYKVVITDGVSKIGSYAFAGCRLLTDMELPASLDAVGEHALDMCKRLTDIWYGGTRDEWEKIDIPESIALFLEQRGVTIHCTDDAVSDNPFTDVGEDAYYRDAVIWAVANGITQGTSETTFSPDKLCTRAQVVAFLWRANGCPEPQSLENPFADVSDSSYYYKAVLWAAQQGITSGVDSSHFAPDRTVRRCEVVTFLWRNAGKPAIQVENPFVDVRDDHFRDAILWAYNRKITLGKDAAHFEPDKICTRAQVVTFLYRNR